MRFWNSIFGNSDNSNFNGHNGSNGKAGNDAEENKGKNRSGNLISSFFNKSKSKKREAIKTRKLQLEQFETRELLSINGPQLNSIFINQDTNRDLLDATAQTMNIAPNCLLVRFSEGQEINPNTLGGIQVHRAGGDGEFGNGDVNVTIGYIGINDEYKNEVIIRFADNLPSDLYQIVFVGGESDPKALKNVRGEGFYNPDGMTTTERNRQVVPFELQLGAKVTSIVPQPITRNADNSLSQSRNTIEVYFTSETLKTNAKGELDPKFFQLMVTQNTVDQRDDFIVLPKQVKYEPNAIIDGQVVNRAILTFENDLADYGTGSFRIRIGEEYLQTETYVLDLMESESQAGDTFHTAYKVTKEISGFDTAKDNPQSLIIHGQVNRQYDPVEYPGQRDDEGHRDLPAGAGIGGENHIGGDYVGNSQDQRNGPTIRYYNFQVDLGNGFTNFITEAQKDLTRMIFDMYSRYMGIQFVESANQGITVATADLAWLGGQSGGGVAGLGGGDTACMDYSKSWGPDIYGGGWFGTAIHEIWHCLGLGHAYDLMPGTDMGNWIDGNGNILNTEKVWPGLEDLIHGQNLYRPDSNDIDMYEFKLEKDGIFSAEVFAQRESAASQLDARIALYKKVEKQVPGGSLNDKFVSYELVAQNDDYFGADSYLEMYLKSGTYYIAVSASGNDNYNPQMNNTGGGGRTVGNYELRLNFDKNGVNRDDVQNSDTSSFKNNTGSYLTDTHNVKFDGDNDMVPGGAYDYWFNVQQSTKKPTANDTTAELEAINRTLFVDNSTREYNADGSVKPLDPKRERDPKVIGDGTLDNPFKSIEFALERASEIQQQLENAKDINGLPMYKDTSVIVRIVGNNFKNDNYNTAEPTNASLKNNKAYEIGVNSLNNNSTLADGARFDVPKNVSVVIDAGVVIKMGNANITVGSSSLNVDRSGGSIQLLGNPVHKVLLTSYFDETIGLDTYANPTAPAPGQWGGIVIRNDLDYEYIKTYDPASGKPRREVLETQGIFLNYINNGDFRYAGGTIGGFVYNPVHIIDARPTVTFNTITNSKHAAVSATPRSFEETRYESWDHFSPFTTGYTRVGLNVHGNTLIVTNTAIIDGVKKEIISTNIMNGLYIQALTPVTTQNVEKITFAAKFNDLDIVHIISENLVLAGDPGGNILTTATAPSLNSGYGALGYDTANTNNDRRLDQLLNFNAVPRDGEHFSLTDGETKITFEFNHENAVGQNISNARRVQAGRVAIDILSTDSIAVVIQKTIDAINAANSNTEIFVPYTIDGVTKEYPRYMLAGQFLRTNVNTDENERQFKITAQIGNDFENTIRLNSTGLRLDIDGVGLIKSRMAGSLVVSPGVIIKSNESRIELEMGTQLLAEGTVNQPIIFTSLYDERYGAGGTFFTSSETKGAPQAVNPGSLPNRVRTPGDWAGIIQLADSNLSLDHVVFAYAGGSSRIEGNLAPSNPIEVHEADARIENSRFEYNSGNTAGNRGGRGNLLTPAVIYVHGSQPVIVNNEFLSNNNHIADSSYALAVMSINSNALNANSVIDKGRSTGKVNRNANYDDNYGPLVRDNRYTDNSINGMVVRGEVLTTDSVWDDSDIVHVLFTEIIVPNFHSTGGLKLMSQPSESLIVKLLGSNAGFTTSGTPFEIDDRIGGAIQVVGVPGYPVLFTSLKDDSVGAGFDLRGQIMYDTNNTAKKNVDGKWTDPSVAAPGDWRSIKFERYSHDRNFVIVKEYEKSGDEFDKNGTPKTAQLLGYLAPNTKSGDDKRRLGYEIHGSIRGRDASEADVYSFIADAGTEIWIDIDKTNRRLDTIIEIIDAEGNVLASSDNSFFEGPDWKGEYINRVFDYKFDPEVEGDPGSSIGFTGGVYAYPLNKDSWVRTNIEAKDGDNYNGLGYNDKYSLNTRDAGLRYITEGTGEKTYYVRIRSVLSISWANDITAEKSHGKSFYIQDDKAQRVTFTFDFESDVSVADSKNRTVSIGLQGVDPSNYAAVISAAITELAKVANRNLTVSS
ncbi:MAG: hypothetical protein ACRC2T_13310, partial [Thermoguttaceae bacterium]